MNTTKHLVYRFEKESKFSHYEMLWKKTALELLNKRIPESMRSKTRVLDVGCGRGEMMQLLAAEGYDVEGFDTDPVCIEMSSKYGNCKQGPVDNIESFYSSDQRKFDVIVSLHVIEHLENPKACIETFARLATGYILLATPNLSSIPFLNFGRKVGLGNPGHICGWNHAHLRNLLENHLKLEIVEWGNDCVRIYDSLPRVGWFDYLLHKSGVRSLVEEKILKVLFPNLGNSLIVLAKSKSDDYQ